jgi:hypothetical protein
MKRSLLIAAFASVIFSAQAQVTFGIHANLVGASMSNKSNDPNNPLEDYDTRFSWKFGGVAQVPITDFVVFMPQLNVLNKGGKFDQTRTGFFQGVPLTVTDKGDVELTYIELPLHFAYTNGTDVGNFFIGVGPSFSFGIRGDVEGDLSGTLSGQTFSESYNLDVKFDGKKDDELDSDDVNWHFKRFELGVTAIVGYQLSNGVFINAHYNYGISDIDPNSSLESKNRYFGIGIGYFFGSRY